MVNLSSLPIALFWTKHLRTPLAQKSFGSKQEILFSLLHSDPGVEMAIVALFAIFQ